jgi:hypothetical protein
LYSLKAIHFAQPITTPIGKTYSIKPGDKVCVKEGELQNHTLCTQQTHEIVECKGMLGDIYFQLTLKDLLTDEIITLKI